MLRWQRGLLVPKDILGNLCMGMRLAWCTMSPPTFQNAPSPLSLYHWAGLRGFLLVGIKMCVVCVVQQRFHA